MEVLSLLKKQIKDKIWNKRTSNMGLVAKSTEIEQQKASREGRTQGPPRVKCFLTASDVVPAS